jgi:hypothetical protein
MGWEVHVLGVAFVMGGCSSILSLTHTLILTLRHPPSLLTVPYPLPPQLLCPPGSHFPPTPLDGDGEEQAECEIWDLTKAKDWMSWDGESGSGFELTKAQPPVPISVSLTRTPGTPALYTLLTEDGRAYAMYTSTQLSHLRLDASGAINKGDFADEAVVARPARHTRLGHFSTTSAPSSSLT